MQDASAKTAASADDASNQGDKDGAVVPAAKENDSAKHRLEVLKEKEASWVAPKIVCIACPNSWKNVVTSLIFNNEGFVAVDFGKFASTTATAGLTVPSLFFVAGTIVISQA